MSAEARDASPGARGRRSPGGRKWFAGLVALVVVLAYTLTRQSRMHGDASWLLVALGQDEPGREALLHPLLFLVHRGLVALLGGASEAVAYAISQVGAVVGLGATYLLARAFGAAPGRALLGTLLLAGAPALWFFATTIEVHALHFGLSACAAYAIAVAPWRRPALATLLTLGVLPAVHASHQFSVVMALGWPALIRFAHERAGRQLGWRRAYIVWGPTVLVVLVATQVAIHRYRTGEWTLDVGEETTILAQYHDFGRVVEMAWRGWLLPLGVLLPVAVAGALRREGLSRSARWTPLLFWVPPVLFLLLVYPVPERGGFLLGSAPFLAVCASRIPWRSGARSATLAAATLVVLQACLGLAAVRSFDRGFDPGERLRAARGVLGERGLLLSGDHLAPVLHHYDPSLVEVHVVQALRRAEPGAHEPDPAAFGPFLASALGDGLPVAIDLSYGTAPDRRTFVLNDPTEEDRRWMDAFVGWVEARYATRLHPDPWWPLLEIAEAR